MEDIKAGYMELGRSIVMMNLFKVSCCIHKHAPVSKLNLKRSIV